MELYVNLSVKFRAFNITWYTVNHVYHLPLNIPSGVMGSKDLVHVNERGVILDIVLQPMSVTP